MSAAHSKATSAGPAVSSNTGSARWMHKALFVAEQQHDIIDIDIDYSHVDQQPMPVALMRDLDRSTLIERRLTSTCLT